MEKSFIPLSVGNINDLLKLGGSVIAILCALWAWKKGAISYITSWSLERRNRNRNMDTMANMFPSWLEYMAEAKSSGERRDAREVRTTAQYNALVKQVTDLGDGINKKLDVIVARIWGLYKLQPQAQFVCDSDGRNIDVNPAYEVMLGTSAANLKGFNYKNFIDPNALESYITEVMQAVHEHRRWEGTVVFRRTNGSRFLGQVRLEPYPEDPTLGNAEYWFGAVTLVEELE